MSTANYQYYSDIGTLYQVTLPTDFAAALGLTPAIGTEPYLDYYIAPRTVTYQALSGAFRGAVLPTMHSFADAPATLTVGGTLYTRVRYIGETANAYVNPYGFLPSGPPGSPGATGATGPAGPTGPAGMSPLTNFSGTIAAAAINGSGAATIATPIAAPGAGKFFSVVRATAFYNYGGTAFSAVGSIVLTIGGTQVVPLFTSTLMTQTASQMADQGGGALASAQTAFVNQPLTITRGGTYSTGNGSIDYNILYQVLST